MKKKERRIHPRIDCSWPVSVLTAAGLVSGKTVNVGEKGAFISCRQPLRAHETLWLTFLLPSGSKRARGQVVWSSIDTNAARKKPIGAGVRLLETPRAVE
ncbi:MAG: PilZ domain-containing protein [Deltaproteobacteria bacterium]|nr:MAG: PilZ domain-containing protein [Deltaproteobacteria bacterium]